MEYDVFISHASEDKESFVEPLTNALKEAGLNVWYDRFELKLGDSLREKIDQGLANSRYGVVVLSKAFFAKEWPKTELDALVTRQNEEGKKVILPVWHEVGGEEVKKFSPILASKLAARSSDGIEAVVDQIVEVCKEKIDSQPVSVFKTGSEYGLRERCLEIIRHDDLLAWRSMIDELTEPIPDQLKKWKYEKGEAAAYKGGEEWKKAFLKAVELCVPGFVPIIASIEVGRMDLWEESFRFVRRLAILSSEMGGGATWTIYIGDSLLYVIGSLGMAMVVKTRQLEIVDKWMTALIKDQRSNEEVPWLKRRSAHFIPEGFKLNSERPFSILIEVREREEIAKFFPDEARFDDCLFLSNLLCSLIEFRGWCSLNPKKRDAIMRKPADVMLDVQPVWFITDHQRFRRLTAGLFGTSQSVIQFALPGQSVDKNQFWTMWKQWKILCMQAWGGRLACFPGRILNWMSLPGEPTDS
jgi:hypothetical protein